MWPWVCAGNPSIKIKGVDSRGTKLFGTVMLLKPRAPTSPVNVKNRPVVVALFTAIVTLDIWVLVMFPLKARLTVPPLPVVAETVAFAWVAGVGVGAEVGVDVGVEFEEPKAKSVPFSEPTYSIPSAMAADDQTSGPSSW